MSGRPKQVAPAKKADRANAGRSAWKVSHPDEKEKFAASLGAWLIHYPGAHAFWEFWAIGLVSLADVEGAPPADKRFPEATHEILFAALDPERALPAVDRWQDARYLHPIDLICQVQLPTDVHAKRILDWIVEVIIDQGVSPDSDNRRWWELSIEKTAEHDRDGVHGAPS
jgi:hypothetical protein